MPRELYPTTQSAGDPIDNYLATLSQVKNYMDQNLPRLEQGVNQILGGSNSRSNRPGPTDMSNALGINQGMFGYPMSKNPLGNGGTDDFVKSLIAQDRAIPTAAINKTRSVSFGAGPDGLNFERYYSHSQFKKLGWQPFRDNESLYNANSSWTDDFGRAASQWGKLAFLGIRQTANNWDNLFTLDSSGDTAYGREMNKLMSIASSTRGGVGGFLTNQFANSAYTFGVLGEFAAEEIALALGVAATEGLGAAPAIAKTGANLFKLGKRIAQGFGMADKAADAIRASKTVDQMAGVTTAVNSVREVSNARKFWNGIGGFLNPLSQTFSTYKNIKNGVSGFDKLTDFAKGSKMFSAFYRDLALMNATMAESRLEGGMVQNDVMTKSLEEWYKNNDKPPEGEDLKNIQENAIKSGFETTMFNLPAIFFSNKIVFDKALNGFVPFRNGGLGTLVENFGKKAGKKYEGFVDLGNVRNWFGKKHRKHIVNQFRPKNLAKNGVRFFAANVTEGAQEVYQEAVAEGVKNYYINKYVDPSRAGSAYYWSQLKDGFDSQISVKGFETFLSGFLMGGIVQGPQALMFQTMPQLIEDYRSRKKDPAKFNKNIDDRKKMQDKVIDFLNKTAESPKDLYNKIYGNFNAQKDFSSLMSDAEEDGNKKQHADVQLDSMFEHVTTLIENGYSDVLTEHIDRLSGLTDQELNEAFQYSDSVNMSKDEYSKQTREKLSAVKSKIEQIQKRYDKYKNITNPFNKDSDDIMEQADYIGFEDVRRAAIYNEYTYDNASKRMGDILSIAQKFAGGKFAGTITNIFNESQLIQELNTLKDEIDVYSQGNDEQQAIGKKKQELYDLLSNLKAGISSYNLTMSKGKSVNPLDKKDVVEDAKLNKNLKTGDNIKYTVGDTTYNGTVLEKTNKYVTIEFEKDGKKQTKKINISSKNLAFAEPIQEEMSESEIADAIEESRTMLANDLRAYLAKVMDIPENSESLDEMIILFQDYYELGVDAKNASKNVNQLNDPNYFFETAKRYGKAAYEVQQAAKDILQQKLDEFLRRKSGNELLDHLFTEFRVFFPPDEIEAFIKEGKMPSRFIDVASKKEIDASSYRYRDILDYLEDYEEVYGVVFKGKIIPEESGQISFGEYSTDKNPSLNKILKDLGITLNDLKEGSVELKDLINYVIKNRYGKPAGRKLLVALLQSVKDGQVININLNQDTAFKVSPETGITLDLRYLASDYDQMQLTFDYAIINPLIQQIVNQNIGDEEFSKAISNLMDATRESFEANKDKMNPQLSIMIAQALSSPQDFMSMALSNSQLQAFLSGIKYQNVNENLWDKALDAVLNFLAKFLGFKNKNNTALQEAYGIMSNIVENKAVSSKEKSVNLSNNAPVRTEPVKVTDDIIDMPKDLVIMLKAQMRSVNNNLMNQGKQSIPDSKFAEWVKTSPEAANLIYRYNVNNGYIKPTEETPVAPEETTETKETEKITLESLSVGDILKMIDKSKYKLGGAKVVAIDPDAGTVTVKVVGEETEYVIPQDKIDSEIESISKKSAAAATKEEESTDTEEKSDENKVNVTSEELKNSNENMSNITSDNTDIVKEINEDFDYAKNHSTDEIDEAFKNSIGCKK